MIIAYRNKIHCLKYWKKIIKSKIRPPKTKIQRQKGLGMKCWLSACSCRGNGLDCQPPHNGTKRSGVPDMLLDLHEYQACTWYIAHSCEQNTCVYKRNKNKKKWGMRFSLKQ